jgi:intraflagellar transport protein 74
MHSQDSLRNNETYRQISHMEDKLSDLLKDNKSLQTTINELNKVILINNH